MLESLPEFIRSHYEVHEWRHASAVLCGDFPDEWNDIIEVLSAFRFSPQDILEAGGSKSKLAGRLDGAFTQRGWKERKFTTRIVIDDTSVESPTHKVDCFRNRVGLEIEWNNKDPFYDRDLNNFRLLFELRALDVGVIVTRCDHLQLLFNQLGRGSSYGNSTTHLSKLKPRVDGGSGGGCPIIVFGISERLYVTP